MVWLEGQYVSNFTLLECCISVPEVCFYLGEQFRYWHPSHCFQSLADKE